MTERLRIGITTVAETASSLNDVQAATVRGRLRGAVEPVHGREPPPHLATKTGVDLVLSK